MTLLHTSVVKELLSIKPAHQNEALAELMTIFRCGGKIVEKDGVYSLEAFFTSEKIAGRVAHLLHALFQVPSTITSAQRSGQRPRAKLVCTEDVAKIGLKLGLYNIHGNPVRGLPATLVGANKSHVGPAWRGAFLSAGKLHDPLRNCTIDILCPTMEAAYGLGGLARRVDIPYRVREARGVYRVEVREPIPVADILRRMGATASASQWEQACKDRTIEVPVHRLENFDDANLRRSATAAKIATIRVRRAFEILGNDIPQNLKEAGQARICHPEDSLSVLGTYLHPQASKDAVAGRLRRLTSMADKVAEDRGIPTTLDAVKEAQQN